MKLNTCRTAALALSIGVAVPAMATLTPYSQNFESLSAASPTGLSADGWLVYGNAFSSGGTYLYGYGPFAAPNGGPGFSAIATGEAGPQQGLQYLNAYNDYNNGQHAIGNLIEANVFQEQVVGLTNIGQTYNFAFDYKAASQNAPAGQTVTRAFIKVLDPNNGYATVAFPNLITTNASTNAWGSHTLSVTIGAGWAGHLLQFGFMSTSTQYEASGVFYDNLSFGSGATLSGTLSLNDFVGSPVGRPIAVTITPVGSSTVLFSGSANLGTGGSYSLSVSGLAAGNYDVSFDGTPFLKKKRSLTWSASGASGVNTSLVNGDADNSGEVDAADIDLVISAFGATVGSGNYSVSVDVDGSDEVDAADIDIVISNFGAVDN